MDDHTQKQLETRILKGCIHTDITAAAKMPVTSQAQDDSHIL
jgi:hypothetical protein